MANHRNHIIRTKHTHTQTSRSPKAQMKIYDYYEMFHKTRTHIEIQS